jgi:hypothetical protein
MPDKESRKAAQGEENGDREHQEDDRHRKRQVLTFKKADGPRPDPTTLDV